jgi:hypothetical protein
MHSILIIKLSELPSTQVELFSAIVLNAKLLACPSSSSPSVLFSSRYF